MPDTRPVLFILGLFVVALGVAMLLPMLVDAATGHPDWQIFALGAGVTVFVGGALILMNRSEAVTLDVRQGFLLTTCSWLVICAFAALPFTFGEVNLSFTDAFFEAMSGLTTTGSTIMVGLDAMPPGVLLWRALLQWLGGIGIIAMAVAMLPFLRVGGMQLFRMESSDRSAKILPRAGQIAASFGAAYFVLSVACAVCYWIAGMGAFDAITHAMATLSTGGFANYDSSFGHYGSAAIDWVGTLFMLAGGAPFVLFVQALRGTPSALWRDSQVHAYLGVVGAASAGLAVWLWLTRDMGFMDALHHSAFNVVSVVTTTGFASTDYTTWGSLAVAVFFFLTFVGGCTGSTAGGIKLFRFEVAMILMKSQMRRLAHPSGVFVRLYHGRPLTDEVVNSVSVFIFVYVVAFALIATGLALVGLDLVTSASGAVTALSNVGPGLGPIIGPAGNFAPLPDAAKWLLSLGMLLGRLEFFTVLVLLTPKFWRP